jgi:LPXTG-motif cell wall-anchored protein
MIRKMLLGAVMLVALFAAPAAAQYPFTVTPTDVLPGSLVNLKGEGCAPQSEVKIKVTYIESYVGAEVPKPIAAYSTTADAEGKFSYSFRMPADAQPGVYELEARCPAGASSTRAEGVLEGPDLVFRDYLIIPLSTTPTTTPGGGGGTGNGTIVRTGSELNGLAIAGAAMLGLGGAFLLATRSRRHRTA